MPGAMRGKPSVEERLRLFGQLCGVVQHLHEHHVIHRDLKPTNVLVNATGSVKLLDFGISKLLQPVAERTILATRSGLHLLTPEYASPEQVRGERVTPRTDVYALGVILYELLTGRKPYRMRSRVMHEVVRAICEDEPERPSTAIKKSDESVDPVTTSRLRQVSPERLSRVLRGDLDEIVMKTLHKAPERRYRTARQLADDLLAHSQGKSVLARADSWPVRAFATVNHYRAPLALVILTTVLLVSGAVTVHLRAIVYAAAVLVVVGLWYAATDRKLGRRLANAAGTVGLLIFSIVLWAPKLLPPTFARVILIAYPIAWDALWVGLAVYSLGGWMYRRRWGGELLLDASTRKHSKFLAILVLLGAIMLIVASRERVNDLIVCAAAALLLLRLWATYGKLEFRQHGIVNAGQLIPWDEIDSWVWQRRSVSPVQQEDSEEVEVEYIASAVFGSKPSANYVDGGAHFLDESPALEPAVLKIERRRLLQFLRSIRVWVPGSKVDDVTRVMDRYFSEWPI